MATPNNTTKTYYDVLTSFPQGMNSGVEPILLPKEQLGLAVNATVRGGYLQPRPSFRKLVMDFGGSTVLQDSVVTGIFQGSGVYRPDFGPSQLIAQISGRLFSFTISGTNCTVTDITIAGDPNDAATSQVWMWQSEKWMIISDGSGKLPIFYDGVTSRRSYGPSESLGTVNVVVSPTTPADAGIGGSVEVTMAAAYSGPYNVPVIFNGALYQTVGSSLVANNTQLDSLSATPAAVIPSNSDVLAMPDRVGIVRTSTLYVGAGVAIDVTIATGSNTVTVGEFVTLSGTLPGTATNYVVISILSAGQMSTLRLQKFFGDPGAYPTTVPGAIVHWLLARNPGGAPNVSVGVTDGPFTIPAGVPPPPTTVNMRLVSAYLGAAGQSVWIGDEIFTITAIPETSSTTLFLINLNDTSASAYGTAPHTLPEDLMSVPELPAGRMGAYGMGRNWMSLTDGISFIAGDIVGGAAGTVANNYRDAVLKTTENDYLAGGGTFRLPNSGEIINAMIFTANLDTSLGQGNLLIGTDSTIFSCNTPVVRSEWAALDNPILTQSLIGFGPLAQNSTVSANSDTLFRSIEGLASLIIARRDFSTWGNTPISREVSTLFQDDNRSLLSYGTSIVFDNRLMASASPRVSAQGVFHMGVVALNFDLLSNLRGKAPPCYDGLWTGLNFLQCNTGLFDGVSRAFAFGFNIDDEEIELYELLPSSSPIKFDNGTTKVKWLFELPPVFREDIKPTSELVRLLDGEVFLRDIDGAVHIKVQYRPDFYPCWIDWHEFDVCADTTPTNSHPGYRTRVGLGEPSSGACEASNNRPFDVGHFFQVRFEITGYCKFMGARFSATSQPQSEFPPPICCPVTPETLPVP